MAFRNLTNVGKEYLATRLANELPVKFIKAKIGNGSVPLLVNPADTKDLYNFKKEVTIIEAVQEQNSIKLTLQVTNNEILEGFYLKEIGIYVDDNGKEVLYWYCNEDNSQYINAQTDVPLSFEIDIMMEVTNINSTVIEWAGKENWISKNYFDEKVRTFEIPTIAELQSRKNLKAGDIVEVLGYYTAGDGAGHKRIISNEDDGSGVQLKNDLWANIVHNSEVNVSWLGAKNNGIDDNTEIIQKAINTNAKFIILNDNVKCNGFFVKEQQKIINKGNLILTGTIFLQESSTFDGGTINLNECFAFTLRADDRKSLRNVTISNVKIFGKKNKSEGAIKFESSINNYVTFCNFINVNIYNCWKGIFGEIRASKFILNLEQNEYPISIVGQQNLILLTGQAGLYTENSKIIYIDGSLNKIYGSFYDVGKKGGYQNIFAEFSENSFDNECPVNLGLIIQGTTRNSYNSYVELNKLFLKDEPAFSITYNNVNTFDESKFFKYDNFYWTITRISDESDGYIELNLGTLVLFSGIEMFFISKEYAFTKVEIYSNDILLTTLIPGSSIFKYVKPTFESYYNNRNQQVKIRCYVNSEVRFRGANLYL